MAQKHGPKSQQKVTFSDQQLPQQLVVMSTPDFEQLLENIVRRVLLETTANRLPADDLLKVNEAAKLFRCDPSTIERWAKQGEMPSVTRGRLKFYSRAQLLEYMERSESNPNDSKSSS